PAPARGRSPSPVPTRVAPHRPRRSGTRVARAPPAAWPGTRVAAGGGSGWATIPAVRTVRTAGIGRSNDVDDPPVAQELDDALDILLRRGGGGVEAQLRVLRRFVGGIDAGEVLELAAP